MFRQPHPDYCVPACLKMVLDCLRQLYGSNEIPNYSISKLAKQIKTDAKNGGQTILENVSLVNDLLKTRNFRIKFTPTYPCEWKTILKENGNGRPVIAWIWDADKNKPEVGTGHSVVVTDVDKENGVIFLNDPARGQISMDIVTFISRWDNENVDKTLILLEIGENNPVDRLKQKKLSEFTSEGTLDG